ncbi:MAG: DUF3616 domain-containing protein [Phycisphaerales bacterium]|nr:MAG: DUF3616 domain-containing protein [Phycisphaerales bacterium]
MKSMDYRLLICLGGVACLLGFLLLGPACTDGEQPASVADGGIAEWTHIDFVDHYSFRGTVFEDKDLSGIAFASPTHGLIGADESGAVQVVELSRADRTLTVLGGVSLLGSGDEIDIEGIAAEGDAYHIVGSHGVAKRTGQYQAKRYKICRLRVDPRTGMAVAGTRPEAASLAGILKADATLGPYFGKPLQQKGINIEGLAIRAGRLFVGLRNPNIEGHAFAIEVAADEVFANIERPAYTLHRLMLGSGLGIREMVAAQSGFLIVAGNAGSEPSNAFPRAQDYEKGRGYGLFWWDGEGSAVRRIGAIPNPPGKAEALTILDETADHATVLILFDGPKQGQPSVYRLH